MLATIAASLRFSGCSLVAIPSFIRCPQRQVVTEQLHDESGVLVRIFGNVVKLRDSLFERLASHLASLFWLAEHLVLKDGEVKGKAQADGVSDGQIFFGHCLCSFICLCCRVCCPFLFVTLSVLCDVAVVVGLHLLVEDLRLTTGGLCNEILVEESKDFATDVVELSLNFCAVLFC